MKKLLHLVAYVIAQAVYSTGLAILALIAAVAPALIVMSLLMPAPFAFAQDVSSGTPDVCKREACLYAPRAELEAIVRQAYEAGKANGLQECRVRSGSFTSAGR